MEKVSKQPLISVVVPIYNVEKYLKKCIDSIITQTYKELEIILVDDESPDGCPKICDDYALKDERIKVIHKKNGGLSDARNAGIDIATGKYITFIDSDDYVEKDFIERLYLLIKNDKSEIAVAPYIILTDKKIIEDNSILSDCIMNQEEAIERMILDKGFTVSACSKLFKTSLFKNVRFPFGRIFEDTATTYKVFLKSKKVSYTHRGGYYYYKRGNSIINSKYNTKQLDFIVFTDQMASDITKKYQNLFEAVESKKIDARFSILRRMVLSGNLSNEDIKTKDSIKQYIKDRKRIILKGNYNKKIKTATVLLLMGEPIFKFFWNIYSKIKYEI